MADINKADFIFRKRNNEHLMKAPGTLNGFDFVIEDCRDCQIFILDHTAQVQIDDCYNCEIFIGPIGGSAFFRDCEDCKIHVACQQFRTRDCKRLSVGLYCSTKPSIETSTEVTFTCWAGAYPGLTSHFASAGLNPATNTWYDIYDFNKGESVHGMVEHWVVDDTPAAEWWEVPVDGEGAPENPVALPDGRLYGGGFVATADTGAAAELTAPTRFPAPNDPMQEFKLGDEMAFKSSQPIPELKLGDAIGFDPSQPMQEFKLGDAIGFDPSQPMQEFKLGDKLMQPMQEFKLGDEAAFAQPFVSYGDEEVLLDDAPAGLSAGLGTGDVEGKVAKAEQEAADKSAKGREAKVYLDTFYQELHLAREQRKANNREAAALKASSQEVVVQSDQLWERIMALIDFNFNCGNGTSDNERFRKAIFKARELRLA